MPDEYDRVRAKAYARIEASFAAGYRLARGAFSEAYGKESVWGKHWGGRGFSGRCCAVGAIAFDGHHPIGDYPMVVDLYALAGRQLAECGVPPARTGYILDAISAGFENEMPRRWHAWSGSRYHFDSYDPYDEFAPYYLLGAELRQFGFERDPGAGENL